MREKEAVYVKFHLACIRLIGLRMCLCIYERADQDVKGKGKTKREKGGEASGTHKHKGQCIKLGAIFQLVFCPYSNTCESHNGCCYWQDHLYCIIDFQKINAAWILLPSVIQSNDEIQVLDESQGGFHTLGASCICIWNVSQYLADVNCDKC